MLLRITLWGMLLGSAIMGYLGYQSGSTTATIVGISAIIFGGFLLFFLAKMTLTAGLVFVKILVIILLIGAVILLGVRGCSVMWQKSKGAIEKISETNKSSTDVLLPGEIKKPSIMDKMKSYFSFSSSKKSEVLPPAQQSQKKQPEVPSVIKVTGQVNKVINGTSFIINGYPVKLFGIDSPDLNQSCLTKRSEQYACGHTAKKKLEKLILNKTLECQIIGDSMAGFYPTTCVIQGYDVGATMVSVGWAVADRFLTPVYIPYEQQAHTAHKGLWAGKFIAPWDYRTRSNQSSKSVVNEATGFFKGLFK